MAISSADDALVGGIIYCWVVFVANVVTLTALFVILRRMKIKRRRAQAGEVRLGGMMILWGGWNPNRVGGYC